MTAAITLVLELLIIVDAPFAGGAQTSSAPIPRVHGLVQARQQNPANVPASAAVTAAAVRIGLAARRSRRVVAISVVDMMRRWDSPTDRRAAPS